MRQITNQQKRLRQEGYQAHIEGQDEESCPFKSWTSEGHNWLHGWWKREYELTPTSIRLYNPDAVATEAEKLRWLLQEQLRKIVDSGLILQGFQFHLHAGEGHTLQLDVTKNGLTHIVHYLPDTSKFLIQTQVGSTPHLQVTVNEFIETI